MSSQMRLAPNGVAYAHAEFMEHYGAALGQRRWDEAAFAEPAGAGLDSEVGGAIVPFAGDALAVPRAPRPQQLRIGPVKHNYLYFQTDCVFNGEPVYACRRGRDEHGPARLYLVFVGSHWEAGDVAPPIPLSAGAIADALQPAFRAATGENVLTVGWHSWECFDAGARRWWPASPFHTAVLL